jgi:hypothetical protein
MIDADTILREQGQMETRRSNFEALWHEVSQLLLPRQADFMGATSGGYATQGAARTERIYDETAMMALDHGCAVFEGEVIPQGGQWQRFVARDPELMKVKRVALWLEDLGNRLFALRNAPHSGFASQTHESVASLLSFGFQGMWTDTLRDNVGRPIGISYRSEHIGQLYIREDHVGAIETTHRKFTLTHRQALQRWGEKAPECAQKAAREQGGKRLDDSGTYIHRLSPNPDLDPDRIDWQGKPILSCYLSAEDRQVFDVGGYRSRPLTCSRYEKSPMEDYGRCPAINVLPAVRASQRIMRDLVTAIEFMAKPALGAHDDMLDQILAYKPGGISYGAIDDRGNQMIQRLWDDPNIGPALQLQESTRGFIQRAFFEDLYLVRQEVKSHVSATERMIRDNQKGILLAPFKRQETEWFTPQTERELDVMADMGLLDDMPPELVEAGGLYQTVYENPLSRSRKADAAAGFYTMLDGVTPLMQLDPQNTVPTFFQEYPFAKVLAGLSDVHGVPVSWSASDEERASAQEEAQALAQKAQLIEVGESAARIARDMAGAEQAAAAAGGPA